MERYEENSKWSTFKSWLVIFIISGSLLAWAMIMMTFVKDAPRKWDFGNIEFTPAKSVYSTNNDVQEAIEKMITPLPEGVSMEEDNTKKTQNDENK